ncbi:hypothetical protein BKA70DRAFT_1127264 [Coprinopsis sp. MPI-PUGE-AT-0042]|nr:hypothetical protein BKA70DRAFT_1127264 [Coprinopsis sp. MPI-PUGE-AT-0042]
MGSLLSAFRSNGITSRAATDWACGEVAAICAHEVDTLTKESSGLHFNATNATEDALKKVSVERLENTMATIAPRSWALLDNLMSADARSDHRRTNAARKRRNRQAGGRSSQRRRIDREDGDGDWVDVSEDDADEDSDSGDESDGLAAKRRKVVDMMSQKKLVCLSIAAQSSNQNCNAFQSSVGIFLHASGAPQAPIEFLSRIGVSIASKTIDSAVTSLSEQRDASAKLAGKSKRTLISFDNLDCDFKRATPTANRNEDTLDHFTTATTFPVHPDVPDEALTGARAVWERSQMFNPLVHTHELSAAASTSRDLYTIHAENGPPPPDGLLRRGRFNAWKFACDLVEDGPEYFKQFKSVLTEPEVVEKIPDTTSKQVPLHAMDINPNTPKTNGDALDNIFRQLGMGKRKGDTDIDDNVVLVSGDLLTIERIRSLMLSHSEESDKWGRLQFLVSVMGLFHFKMACADAIWRMFILPKAARDDTTCVIDQIGLLRPKETGKIKTSPGFRRMHESIQHTGKCLRLETWNEHVKKKFGYGSLEEWAAQKPRLEQIIEISKELARDHVGSQTNFLSHRFSRVDSCDQHHENILLQQQLFLLYEETSYAMNLGDIGRVETCFLPWAFTFLGCGKHKYANEIFRYLKNVWFVYPEGLR